MNKLIIATVITGAAVAGLLLYIRSQSESRFGNDIADAAEDAHDTMNKHIKKTERAFDYALN